MFMKLEKQKNNLSKEEPKEVRDKIVELENSIKEMDGAIIGTKSERYPLKHSFSDGIYVREIFIPKGDTIVGMIHKHEHPNFLMEGTVHVFTEGGGGETLVAPCHMISPPGTKRVLYAETDLRWVTIHNNPTNTQDIDELEASIAVGTYNEYEAYKKKEKSLPNKVMKSLIKFLEICR